VFRIISGKCKGKKIIAPKKFTVRPTTDFAKEALFSIIEHKFDIENIAILDLFAGIGSISLEFASRGAIDINSIEINQSHCEFIRNISKELDFETKINIYRNDVFSYLNKYKKDKKQYDLVFADPPFDMDEAKYIELINLILKGDILSKNGIFILEHQSKRKFEHINLQETRKYGNIGFSFFTKKI